MKGVAQKRVMFIRRIKCRGFKDHKPHFFDHYSRSGYMTKEFCDVALRLKSNERGRRTYDKKRKEIKFL